MLKDNTFKLFCIDTSINILKNVLYLVFKKGQGNVSFFFGNVEICD